MLISLIIVSVIAIGLVLFAGYQADLSRNLRKSEAAAWDQVSTDSEKIASLEKLLSTAPSFWLVGQYKSGRPPYVAWDMVGIFTKEDQARDLCTSRAHFLARIQGDVNLLKEEATMPKIEYPLAKGAN